MATEQLTQMLLQGTWDTLYVTVVSTLLAYIIGIPLAAGVWIPIFGWTLQPMFGALAMSLSSFCVVTNALRLNLFRLHEAKQQGDTPLICFCSFRHLFFKSIEYADNTF